MCGDRIKSSKITNSAQMEEIRQGMVSAAREHVRDSLNSGSVLEHGGGLCSLHTARHQLYSCEG